MRSQKFMTLGSTLVVLGIIFCQDKLIGYSFIGAGVLLSIITAARTEGKAEEAKATKTGGR